MLTANYAEVRSKMQPGDVIAFGGSSNFSKLIKTFTRSSVSHVGVILHTQVVNDGSGRYFNQIIESTGDGVEVYRASKRIDDYDGDVWWLPLRERDKLNLADFYDFLFSTRGREYDNLQVASAGLDLLDNTLFGLTENREDFSRFFCSELVAAGLEAGGCIPKSVNCSEVTPIDLCRWSLYRDDYTQLKASEGSRRISRYNSEDPAHWAQEN